MISAFARIEHVPKHFKEVSRKCAPSLTQEMLSLEVVSSQRDGRCTPFTFEERVALSSYLTSIAGVL